MKHKKREEGVRYEGRMSIFRLLFCACSFPLPWRFNYEIFSPPQMKPGIRRGNFNFVAQASCWISVSEFLPLRGQFRLGVIASHTCMLFYLYTLLRWFSLSFVKRRGFEIARSERILIEIYKLSVWISVQQRCEVVSRKPVFVVARAPIFGGFYNFADACKADVISHSGSASFQ